MQLALHHDTVLKVAHQLRSIGLPPGLSVQYCQAVRKKWEEAAAHGDTDFDLNQLVRKVDEDLARVRFCSPLDHVLPNVACSLVWHVRAVLA